ncbi:MAG: GrpB family protein [Rhodobacteraceae bacterium]|nr:GrpB family protein [Paracoccaceae bacterium]
MPLALVQSRTVVFHPHHPYWSMHAAEEAGRIATVLADDFVTSEHIGATAVPSVSARAILDIVVIVKSLAAVDAAALSMVQLGYTWRPDLKTENTRVCDLISRRTGECVFRVTFAPAGSPEIERRVAFRDFLRTHPDEALTYNTVKIAASEEHPDDHGEYESAKAEWMAACERRALAWRKSGVAANG